MVNGWLLIVDGWWLIVDSWYINISLIIANYYM